MTAYAMQQSLRSPHSAGQLLRENFLFFILKRAQATKRWMRPFTIIVNFNIFKDSLFSFFSGTKGFSSYKLNLKRIEKTFDYGIIPAITFSAHVADTTVLIQQTF